MTVTPSTTPIQSSHASFLTWDFQPVPVSEAELALALTSDFAQETVDLYCQHTLGNSPYAIPTGSERLFQGLNGLFLRYHMANLERLAALIPQGTRREFFFRFGFHQAIELARRFGLRPFCEIVWASPRESDRIIGEISGLSELVERIGITPFVSLARRYEGNTWEILRKIRGERFIADGKEECRHSLAGSIKSTDDLLSCAGAIDEFLQATADLGVHDDFPFAGYLAGRYGIENLPHLGRIASLMSQKAFDQKAFEWTRHRWGWTGPEIPKGTSVLKIENVIDEMRSAIECFGMGFVADALKLFTTSCESFSLFSGDRKSFDIASAAVMGLLGNPANAQFVRTHGLEAFRWLFEQSSHPPLNAYYSALATCAHLMTSAEDLERIGKKLMRWDGYSLYTLHKMRRFVDSEATLEEAGRELGRLTSAFLPPSDRPFSHRCDDEVYDAIVGRLVNIAASLSDLARAASILEKVAWVAVRGSESLLTPISLVASLINTPEEVSQIAKILRSSELWLLPAVRQDIRSIADLSRFALLGSRIHESLGADDGSERQKPGRQEAATLCTSLERMEIWLAMREKEIAPTEHLLSRLSDSPDSEDREAVLSQWCATLASFSEGEFDPTDELHRNLEYTRFRRIVDDEKIRRHVKNHFTFAEYEAIFRRSGDPATEELPEKDRFEIECVAHESQLLSDFIAQVAARARELGRPVIVVPNLSYGYLPVAPLVEELEREGIEVAIGAKVGSTESHNNREVVDSRLFKGYRRRIARKRPILIVVDGTQHLVDREGDGKEGRYPDAYQGYLNQVIAINDASGLVGEDYSRAGKTTEDLSRLRATEEYQRLVGVFREMIPERRLGRSRPYTFRLWNTAGMPLVIRSDRAALANVAPMNPDDLDGPAIVFCNVGVLDNQISESIKARYPDQTHTPAYFDDSGRILGLDFGHDRFGVRYINRIETELRRLYEGETAAAGSAVSFLARLGRGVATLYASRQPYGVAAEVHAGV